MTQQAGTDQKNNYKLMNRIKRLIYKKTIINNRRATSK